MNASSPRDDAARISVVVPTFRRARQLQACMKALGRLQPPGPATELIVADDGGDVDEHDAEQAAGREVRIVAAGGAGPAGARNLGARVARGELLLFTDDDCEPEPEWITALWRAHQDAPDALLGGTTVNALPDNAYSRAAHAIGEAALAHHNGGAAGPRFFPSNNIAVPAARFAGVGGFDAGIRQAGGEDRDFCERWAERGWPLVAEPRALVRHAHPLTLRSFWRQQSAYGAGAYHHRRRRAARGGERRLQPAITSGLASLAARRALHERDWAVLALLGVWQAAGASGFAAAALSSRRAGR